MDPYEKHSAVRLRSIPEQPFHVFERSHTFASRCSTMSLRARDAQRTANRQVGEQDQRPKYG